MAASLVAAKKSLKRNVDPDFLFIEPSEMVVTAELKSVVAMGKRDIAYDIGPFFTLVKGSEFDGLWRDRYFLMAGQIRDADLVGITHSDRMNTAEIRRIQRVLGEYASDIVPMSVRDGDGLPEILARVSGEG